MDEPRVTCNADKWCKYLAELIKNNGIGKCEIQDAETTGNLTLNDVARKNIQELMIKGNTTQITTTGINMFDGIFEINKDIDYTTGEIIDKKRAISTNYIQITPNTKYTFKKKIYNNVKQVGLRFYDIDKNYLGPIGGYSGALSYLQFTTPSNAYYMKFIDEMNTADNEYQIELGYNTSNAIEPYTGCKPSPSIEYPQEVKGIEELDLKIVGKNLFDMSLFETKNFIYNGAGSQKAIRIALEPNTKYTISRDYSDTGANSTVFCFVYNSSFNSSTQLINSNSTGSQKVTVTTNKDGYLYIGIDPPISDATVQKILNILKYIQIEKGSNATDYEPYTEQHIKYKLPRPMYSLSNICDYIDLDRGKFVYNVTNLTVDGNGTWNVYTNTNIETKGYNGYFSTQSIRANTSIQYADKLPYYASVSNPIKECCRMLNQNFYILIKKDRNIDTIEKIKDFLNENPITIYFMRNTLLEEDIPSDLLEQLRSLYLNKPTTNIISNVPLSFKYYSKYKASRLITLYSSPACIAQYSKKMENK